MATKLRDAADSPGEVSRLDSLVRNIRRWEHAGTAGMTERYRLLYCQVFDRTEFELFGIGQPDMAASLGAPDPVPDEYPSGNCYVTVVLPRASQRILIEIIITGDAGEQAAESQPPPLLRLVNDSRQEDTRFCTMCKTTRLSSYNKGHFCSPCERKAFNTAHATEG